MTELADQRPSVARIRVSLVGSSPEIWRLLEVNASLPLDRVHDVLQIAFGWRDMHLHSFSTVDPGAPPGTRAVPIIPRTWMSPELLDDGHQGINEEDTTLGDALAVAGGVVFYTYDFGDSWEHRIELTETIDGATLEAPALLIRGECRGPLEDSGGIDGYEHVLAVLADPSHPEHSDVRDWVQSTVGPWERFDPETFSPADVSAEFQHLDGLSSLPPSIDALADRMYPSARRDFRSLARSALSGPSTVDAQVAERMVRPFTWLLELICTDGLQLTSAGWLPPAVVSAGMHDLGWEDRWLGTFNREVETLPIRDLRASAQRLGLVRKLKGRLMLGSAAKRAAGDPGGLWRVLATALALRHGAEAASDAALLLAVDVASGRLTSRTEFTESVGMGLEVLGWAHRNGDPLESQDVDGLFNDTWRVLFDLGVFVDGDRFHTISGVTEEGRTFARTMLTV
jgi:hypothetical protein